ncbi:hypothetical protein LCGC14_0667000 [marine sediment metagenome]|uniref:Uncharacterized protein n=1 Tax=marine sediment metagenome TaxID=412755 RepID=A0A0F9U044_9ZZZZ
MNELNIKITKATDEKHNKQSWAWSYTCSYIISFEDGYRIIVNPGYRVGSIIDQYKKNLNAL